MSDWVFPYDGQAFAGRDGFTSTWLDLEGDNLSIKIEQGSGYLGQYCNDIIPVSVVIGLLTRAGYDVTKREAKP